MDREVERKRERRVGVGVWTEIEGGTEGLVSTDRQRHREREGERETHRERRRDIETESQRETETQRERRERSREKLRKIALDQRLKLRKPTR